MEISLTMYLISSSEDISGQPIMNTFLQNESQTSIGKFHFLQEQLSTLKDIDVENLNSLEDFKTQQLALLDEMSRDQVFEENEVEITRILLQSLGNSESLLEEDISILENIADQCPLEGGGAVYKARSLLTQIGDYVYDDATTCQQAKLYHQENGTIEDFTKSFSIVIYPNPASNIITIEVTGKMKEHSEIQIRDVIGQLIYSQSVSTENQRLKLDVSIFNAGVYTLSLESSFKNSVIEKIVIVK